MCKAGFAGDEAPKAVFRMFQSSDPEMGLPYDALKTLQHRSLVGLAIMGTYLYLQPRVLEELVMANQMLVS